jgi:hypothetical protein
MQLSRPFFRATLVAAALIVSSALGASAHELDQSDGGSRAVFVQTGSTTTGCSPLLAPIVHLA